MTPLRAAAVQNGCAGLGLHAGQKAVGLGSAAAVRLKGALRHGTTLLLKLGLTYSASLDRRCVQRLFRSADSTQMHEPGRRSTSARSLIPPGASCATVPKYTSSSFHYLTRVQKKALTSALIHAQNSPQEFIQTARKMHLHNEWCNPILLPPALEKHLPVRATIKSVSKERFRSSDKE
jgi:hypothetical protein